MSSFYFREAFERLSSPSRLAPYLLVPPLLALTVTMQNTVPAMSWLLPLLAPQNPVWGRLGLALWNASLVAALLSGIIGTGFFPSTFGSGWFRSCLALPAGRSAAYWQTALVHLLISACVLALTWAAIITALHVPPGFPLVATLAGGLALLLWTACFSAFAGLLAPSWGAGMLQAGLAFAGLVAAPASAVALAQPLSIGDLAMPPLGRMVIRGMAGWPDWVAAAVLFGQALFFAVAGLLIFRLSVRLAGRRYSP